MSDFLTVRELAERLRTTPAALHMQRQRGQLPGAFGVKVGRRILWSAFAVDAWFAAQQAAAEATAAEARR